MFVFVCLLCLPLRLQSRKHFPIKKSRNWFHRGANLNPVFTLCNLNTQLKKSKPQIVELFFLSEFLTKFFFDNVVINEQKRDSDLIHIVALFDFKIKHEFWFEISFNRTKIQMKDGFWFLIFISSKTLSYFLRNGLMLDRVNLILFKSYANQTTIHSIHCAVVWILDTLQHFMYE